MKPVAEMNHAKLKHHIQGLLTIVAKMCEDFPSRRFTLDGKLVGDIGEILAAELYDLTLYDENEPGYDGFTSSGQKVQIRTTMKQALYMRETPDYFLGIHVNEPGEVEELFNGPGRLIEERVSHWKLSKNGTRNIRINLLRNWNALVPAADRIPRRIVVASSPLEVSTSRTPEI